MVKLILTMSVDTIMVLPTRFINETITEYTTECFHKFSYEEERGELLAYKKAQQHEFICLNKLCSEESEAIFCLRFNELDGDEHSYHTSAEVIECDILTDRDFKMKDYLDYIRGSLRCPNGHQGHITVYKDLTFILTCDTSLCFYELCISNDKTKDEFKL